jgi:hypothetical protein
MDPSFTVRRPISERASGVLRRVLWIASSVLRGLTILGVAAGIAVGVTGVAWLADSPPASPNEWIARLMILGALLTPPVVLLLFVAGLRDLRNLPERARALPADARARALDVREQARRAAQPRGIVGAIGALFQLGRLVLGSREALSPFGSVAIVLRPAMLIAAVFAALTAVLEIPAALVFLLILALT